MKPIMMSINYEKILEKMISDGFLWKEKDNTIHITAKGRKELTDAMMEICKDIKKIPELSCLNEDILKKFTVMAFEGIFKDNHPAALVSIRAFPEDWKTGIIDWVQKNAIKNYQ